MSADECAWEHLPLVSGPRGVFTARRSAAPRGCAAAVSWLLLGLRFLGTMTMLIVSWALSAFGTVCLSAAAAEAPLAPWRVFVTAPVRLFVARALAFLLGFHRIEMVGQPAPRAVAPIVVANHISLVEPVVLMALTGGMPVSAAENRGIPLVGPSLVATQAIFVNRDRSAVPHGGGGGGAAAAGKEATPTSAALPAAPPHEAAAAAAADSEDAPFELPPPPPPPGADINAKIAYRARNDDFPRLLIFPEGTTTNGSALLAFRSGAFRPGVPVQPVVVAYPRAAGSVDPAWVSDGPGGLAIAAALWRQPSSRISVRFLPVYYPSAAEQADAELYASNVQRAMAAALGVPTTQYTYEDIQLTLEAIKAGYPVDDAVVQFDEVRRRRAGGGGAGARRSAHGARARRCCSPYAALPFSLSLPLSISRTTTTTSYPPPPLFRLAPAAALRASHEHCEGARLPAAVHGGRRAVHRPSRL